jgi:hypothetical protein
VNEQRLKIGFTLVLLVFVIHILVLTLGLGRIAALVPAWVGLFTLVLLLVQLYFDFRPAKTTTVRDPDPSRFSLYDRIKAGAPGDDTLSGRKDAFELSQMLRVSLWFVLMLVCIYLVGLLFAVPLYAFLYWNRRAQKGWRPALTMAGTMLGALYGFLVLMLEKSLHKGQLAVWLGF